MAALSSASHPRQAAMADHLSHSPSVPISAAAVLFLPGVPAHKSPRMTDLDPVGNMLVGFPIWVINESAMLRCGRFLPYPEDNSIIAPSPEKIKRILPMFIRGFAPRPKFTSDRARQKAGIGPGRLFLSFPAGAIIMGEYGGYPTASLGRMAFPGGPFNSMAKRNRKGRPSVPAQILRIRKKEMGFRVQKYIRKLKRSFCSEG